MQRKVTVQELAIGMFVADLDRPWIDTPFLLQGFQIEDAEQLAQLRQHCKWVMIDPQRSAGPEFDAPQPRAPAAAREVGSEPRVVVQRAAKPSAATPATGAAPRPAKPDAGTGSGRAHAGTAKPPREFAIGVERRQGSQAAEPPLAPPRGNFGGTRAGADNGGGLWRQLRDGVSGLFARKESEHIDIDAVAAEPMEPVAPTRASFMPETVQLTIYEDQKRVEDEVGAATDAYDRTNALLYSVAEDIRAGGNLQLESVEEVISDMVESMVRNPDALMWVARMREKDLNVYGHGLSVAVSLIAFGRHLGYPKDQLSQLGMLGLLLDVGKIKLPRELLEKNARLSAEEFEQIKDHVELGLDILTQTPNIHPDVLEGIAQHHERMNGTGYPNNLMGEHIGMFGRMAAIADTYAAVTKHRPYAEAVSPHEALQMLSNWGGSQFHVDMVEQFIQSIGVFPVGSLVELSTGEVAVIVTHNKLKRLRPKVLVVTDEDKTLRHTPSSRDLLYDVSDKPTYIRRGLPSNAYGIDPREYYLQ
jgi:HD-GYP domain-containing protein (c-di-GMP phosphodiesterase class II)